MTVIANFGWFGMLWTLMALGITIGHAVNFFGKRGISAWDVEVQPSGQRTPGREPATEDFETKLRRLERLKDDGLITEDEYRLKRSEILDEKW